MAHFAEIDENNVVLRVVVVDDLQEEGGADFLANTCGLGGTWLKTSYNTIGGQHQNGGIPFRKNFAGPGSVYDPERDAFIGPKPYASWLLDEETCQWEAPTPRPAVGFWQWDEATLSWVEEPTE